MRDGRETCAGEARGGGRRVEESGDGVSSDEATEGPADAAARGRGKQRARWGRFCAQYGVPSAHIAVQKLEAMIAMVSSPSPRCLMPKAGSHVAVACSRPLAKKHMVQMATITTCGRKREVYHVGRW